MKPGPKMWCRACAGTGRVPLPEELLRTLDLVDPDAAKVFMRDVRVDECRGIHPPEWDESACRFICTDCRAPLDVRARPGAFPATTLLVTGGAC